MKKVLSFIVLAVSVLFANPAQAQIKLGVKVVTLSGPDGYIYDPNGISGEKIDYMLELRSSGNDVCAPYADKFPGSTFVAGKKPWEVKVDICLPCATQNELNGADADMILANGALCVAEVSNMGCTAEAVDKFIKKKKRAFTNSIGEESQGALSVGIFFYVAAEVSPDVLRHGAAAGFALRLQRFVIVKGFEAVACVFFAAVLRKKLLAVSVYAIVHASYIQKKIKNVIACYNTAFF